MFDKIINLGLLCALVFMMYVSVEHLGDYQAGLIDVIENNYLLGLK